MYTVCIIRMYALRTNYLHTIDTCDSNSNAVTIGAVVGAFCVVIIIMVITNIIVWIYCFRKRHHTGMYVYIYVHQM